VGPVLPGLNLAVVACRLVDAIDALAGRRRLGEENWY
jgi:hypothetical protein